MSGRAEYENPRDPYGIKLTKRLVVKAAEQELYERHELDQESHAVELVDYMGGDALVERVATAGHGIEIFPEAPHPSRFIRHLAATRRADPFKWVQLKFRVQSSIADALHIVYEQRGSVNEYSGRYSEMIEPADLLNPARNPEAHGLLKKLRDDDFGRYEALIGDDVGLTRELSRIILGTNNDTRYILKIDLYSLIDFIQRKRGTLRKESSLHQYLDTFETMARAVAPESTGALLRGGKRLRKLTMPTDNTVIDPLPLPARWKPDVTRRVVSPELEELLYVPQQLLDAGAVQAIEYMGDDCTPAQTARTSYGKGTSKKRQDETLIRYLYRHLHTSPFESVELAVEGKTPVFVDPRQAKRHRTLDTHCFMGEDCIGSEAYMPAEEQLRFQSTSNKQGRGLELSREQKIVAQELLKRSYDAQEALVTELREHGLNEEQLRMMRGVGHYTFESRTGDLKNWLHFLGLRDDPHAQLEVQEYARTVGRFVEALAPSAYGAYLDYKKNAISFSAAEQAVLEDLRNGQELTLELLGERGIGKFEAKNEVLPKLKKFLGVE